MLVFLTFSIVLPDVATLMPACVKFLIVQFSMLTTAAAWITTPWPAEPVMPLI